MIVDQQYAGYLLPSEPGSEESCQSAVKDLSGNQGPVNPVDYRDPGVQASARPVTVDDGIKEPSNLDHILRAHE